MRASLSLHIYKWSVMLGKVSGFPTRAAAVAAFLEYHKRLPMAWEVKRYRVYL